MEPFKSAPDPDPPRKPTILTLEYGNKSSKASLQLDLSENDVQIEMSGSRTKTDTAWRNAPAGSPYAPTSPQAQNSPTGQPVVVNVTSGGASGRQAAAQPEDSGTMRVRRIVDSTVTITTNKTPDSTLRKVVSHIRKAQELFYAGRYAEAEDKARRANELKPTAEGLALAGSIAWVRKDKEGAMRSWSQARELDPDFPGLSAMLDSAVAPRQELSR
jgi:tetratricopeptide (TPR) repeat protein